MSAVKQAVAKATVPAAVKKATQKKATPKKESPAQIRTRLIGVVRNAKAKQHYWEIVIGEALGEAKATWKETETQLWLDWCREKFGYSKSTAYRYLKAADVNKRVPGADAAFDGNTTTMEWAARLHDAEILQVMADPAVKKNPTLENVQAAALRVSEKEQQKAVQKQQAADEADEAAKAKQTARERQIGKAISKTLPDHFTRLQKFAETDLDNALRVAMVRGAIYMAAYPKDVGLALTALKEQLRTDVKADADAEAAAK